MSNDTRQLQPSKDPKVFYRQTLEAVMAPCAYLVHDHWYLLADLMEGSDIWDSTDKGVHIRAGRSFGWMVGKGKVPFEAVPRHKWQTGSSYYKYIGPQIYQGDDPECQQKY